MAATFGNHGKPMSNLDSLMESFKEGRKKSEQLILSRYRSPDACDMCRATVEGTKLMRCSRCLLARYCGRDCQKRGWKEGKQRFAEPGFQEMELWFSPAHKEVCYDAKVVDVRELM